MDAVCVQKHSGAVFVIQNERELIVCVPSYLNPEIAILVIDRLRTAIYYKRTIIADDPLPIGDDVPCHQIIDRDVVCQKIPDHRHINHTVL